MFIHAPDASKARRLAAAVEYASLDKPANEYRPDELDLLIAEDCARYYHDPLGFVLWAFDWGHDDLEGRYPDQWQIDLMNDIGASSRANNFNGSDPVMPIREAVASGHGIGKSALVAWLILWIMSTRPYAKGTVTANTAEQLQSKTWAELAKWKTRCITGNWFELNSGKGSLSLYHKAFPETWMCKASTCREENSEAFAGQHAENSTSFYIFDEGSAVPDKIWEVAEGGLTDGEPMFFTFGNPTRNVGQFKKCFNMNSGWRSRNIDSRTCRMPNKELHKDWIDKWGIDSDFVRVRILGRFPNADDTQFMPSNVVADAMAREPGMYLGNDPLIMGFDVARGGGDNCVIMFRRGKDAKSEKVYVIPAEKSRNSMRVISMLTMIINRHMPDQIFVDETGIGGPVLDRLAQLGYPALGVKFGGDADDKRLYSNKTAEMSMRCLEWMQHGGSIPDESQLEQELIARTFGHNKHDQLVMEPKDELKRRIGCSPDWADALLLTFAYYVPPLTHARGMKDVSWHARENVLQGTRDYSPLDLVNQGSTLVDYDPLRGM
jgi:hypothetical protein